MRIRILIALVASLVSLSACGQGGSAGSGSAAKGHVGSGPGGIEQVRDAAAALRRAGTATVSGTAVLSFMDSGVERRIRTEQEGTYRADGGAWGPTVHTRFTEFPIEPVDETAESTPREKATLDWWHLGDASLRSHDGANASPLTGLVFVERAVAARADGTERRDGVRLARWKVTVPAEAAYELLGDSGGSGSPDLLAIDCVLGLPMTVWIDDQGRFRGFRLVTEYRDGDRFDAEFGFGDLGRPLPADTPPPPQHWIDGVLELQEGQDAGQGPTPAPKPCAGRGGNPTGR